MWNPILCFVVAALVPAISFAGSLTFVHTSRTLQSAMDALAERQPQGTGDPAALASTLGELETIFAYVRDQMPFERYAGRVRGPRGTLRSGAGNDVDQSELLVTMLTAIGTECRYARGRRTLLSGESFDHVWVQVKEGDEWHDLDPIAQEMAEETNRQPRASTMGSLPPSLSHRVRLDVKYRVRRSGKQETLTSLGAEFDVAALYGLPLTLANRFEGDHDDGNYIITAIQPVLMLGDSLIPGTVVSTEKDPSRVSPAGRLGGLFDRLETQPPAESSAQPDLEILSQWLEVQVSSPGLPRDRFQYVVYDRENESRLTAKSPDALIAVQAFAFSPAVVTDDEFFRHSQGTSEDVRALTTSVSRISALEFTANGPSETMSEEDASTTALALEKGQRALASTALMYYLLRSDQALQVLGEEHETRAFHDVPRAVVAAVFPKEGNIIYDLDLRRNRVTFAVSDSVEPARVKMMNYHRGVFESRLEGAVLKAFTGQPGITTADVVAAATAQGIPLMPLCRQNRQEMNSLQLAPGSRRLITAAVGSGRTVMVPQRPALIDGEELFAWYEYDPETGFIEGVFPSGKHQGMSEYVSEEAVIQTLVSQGMSYLSSSLVGYYFSIATGLGHFYACLLDLDHPNKACFGQPDVCLPAQADAVALCKAWKDAKQYFDFGSAAVSLDIGGLIPWPDAWEALAGGPCENGAAAGLRLFGCRN